MTPSEELAHDFLDAICEAIEDSLGPDWTCRDGAKAVLRLFAALPTKDGEA